MPASCDKPVKRVALEMHSLFSGASLVPYLFPSPDQGVQPVKCRYEVRLMTPSRLCLERPWPTVESCDM